MTVLGTKAKGWWTMLSVMMEPGVGVMLGINYYPTLLAFLGALTALACGAWRTAVLVAFVCAPTLLMAAVSHEQFRLQQMFGPSIAGVTIIACLVWSYRRSVSRGGGRG